MRLVDLFNLLVQWLQLQESTASLNKCAGPELRCPSEKKSSGNLNVKLRNTYLSSAYIPSKYSRLALFSHIKQWDLQELKTTASSFRRRGINVSETEIHYLMGFFEEMMKDIELGHEKFVVGGWESRTCENRLRSRIWCVTNPEP